MDKIDEFIMMYAIHLMSNDQFIPMVIKCPIACVIMTSESYLELNLSDHRFIGGHMLPIMSWFSSLIAIDNMPMISYLVDHLCNIDVSWYMWYSPPWSMHGNYDA